MNSTDSVAPYFKDPLTETLLDEVNESLLSLEQRLTAQFNDPKHPVILIGGLPRTGTTLLMQLLSASFKIGYVNNLMARFWQAPYVGAMISLDLRQRQMGSVPSFVSELGATTGYEGPHEFGFFWRRWFPWNETHQVATEDLQSADFTMLQREIAGLESAFNAPMAFKNPIVFNLHMDVLARILPTALFIVCEREPIYVAQSILESRVKRHGTPNDWLGVKPTQYKWLKKLSPLDQVAGQIHFVQRKVEASLSKLSLERFLRVDYQTLCRSPWETLQQIQAAVEKMGSGLEETGFIPERFEPTDTIRMPERELQMVENALARLQDGSLKAPARDSSQEEAS